MSAEDQEQEVVEASETLDIHDIDKLKQLWFVLRDAENSKEVFALVQLLITSLPYDWVDPEHSWLHLAQQLEDHGESELASLFKLANQRAFQLSLKGL
jgi:hypothetical protein